MTAAMCMAVGKVSLLDWDMFTWSLGCTGSLEPRTPPAISMARFEMTSLTFMLVWVPEPVCQMRSGNSPISFPSMTSRAARSISEARSWSSLPSAWFTWAEASLRTPKARISAGGMVSWLMAKWCRLRSVWAPQ